MPLEIDFLPDTAAGRLTATSDVPPHIWARAREIVLAFEPDARMDGRSIVVEWGVMTAAASELADLRRRTAVAVTYSPEARALLTAFAKEVRAAQSAARGPVELTAEQALVQLSALGFTERALKPYQVRDVCRLAALAHGANFSVPGAGKTTVTLAVHLLTQGSHGRLLVVAPKNAFSAWDEVLVDCLGSPEPSFVRLSESMDQIRSVLLMSDPPRRLIISYDQLTRHVPIVNSYLLRFPVHLVLDESHRIKAGAASQRGSAAASVSHLARRRDILSGTPLPQGLGDLEAQLEFLWPSQGISTRVLTAGRPRDVLAPYYVRTTKSELHLGPVVRHYEQIVMTDAQVALYGLVRDALLRREAGLRSGPTMAELDLAKRSVLSLLQICSNPILLARRLAESATLVEATDRQVLTSILGQIIEDGDSPKILGACQRALSLVAQGRKVVVWSAFTDTVERVASVLASVGATFIHGGVNTGAIDDPSTREARVAAFNDANSSTMVLVANPAACSEGISLHRHCGNAIYVDRSFNAAHFLQSVDRIHRLGIIPEDRPTHIEILEAITPAHLGSVDFSVRRRLRNKLETMAGVLEDPDLRQLALDESTADAPTTGDVTLQDILDVIEQLRGRGTDPGEEPL
jgi:SNF2 family DNA or RNA helicase